MKKPLFLCLAVILGSCDIVESCIIHSIIGSDGNFMCCTGYSRNVNGECVLQSCENCDGICLGNNICMCRYGKVNGKCVGFCESQCKNGHCVGGVCICNEGFRKPEIKVHKNSEYFYDDDYEYHEEDLQSCQPICKNCDNGKCLSPSTCQCNEGYERKGERCAPICENCYMGICLAPNRCDCLPGYKMGNNTCVPHCYGQCPEGNCVRPGVCKCDDGFRWSFYQERCLPNCFYNLCKEGEICDDVVTGKCICKKGYKRDEITLKCEPICDNVCINGFCSAPNICSCNANFTHKNSTYCELRCDPICPRNSVCNNGTCECNKNYKKFGDICVPDCNCKNGICIVFDSTPGCLCKVGYVRNPKNSSECITQCERDGCENGFCGNYGKDCICHLHYQKDNSTGKCVKCEPGTNCNGVFMPYACDRPCQHGICIQTNTCACNHGYDKTYESHICGPICLGGCSNGLCKSPHNCECNEGYEKVGEKCQPVCNHQCINGICVAPNTCNCTEGHKFVSSSKYKCKKVECHQEEPHNGQEPCQSQVDSIAKSANLEQAVPDEKDGSNFWTLSIYIILVILCISVVCVGVILYLKNRRNASFPIIENFVYNRMSE